MKIKRDKVDDVFSKLVRTRDNWTCQRCDKYFPDGERGGLHCSHFWSRRHKSTRWDLDNACAHCFTCHQYLGENPIEFRDWILKRIGRQKFDLLESKARSIVKLTQADKEAIYQDLKRQLASMSN